MTSLAPSLSKLCVSTMDSSKNVSIRTENELTTKILERAAFLRVRFIPGTAGNLVSMDVPMLHHPDPPEVDVALLFIRGLGDWEASPIVKNAGFKVIDSERRNPIVVARRIDTLRVPAIHTPWNRPSMELSLDRSTPTILSGHAATWKTMTSDDISLRISSPMLETLITGAMPIESDLTINLRVLKTPNKQAVHIDYYTVAIAAYVVRPSADVM